MDARALPLEQGGDRIAYRRATSVADVQWTGRIRGDELDHRSFRPHRHHAAVAFSLVQNAGDDGSTRAPGEEHIDETGAADLDFFDPGRGLERRDQRRRELARIALERLRKLQRDVARIIAVLGLLGPFERQRRDRLSRSDAGERRTQAVVKVCTRFDQGDAATARGRQNSGL